jgi:hypothetical protein
VDYQIAKVIANGDKELMLFYLHNSKKLDTKCIMYGETLPTYMFWNNIEVEEIARLHLIPVKFLLENTHFKIVCLDQKINMIEFVKMLLKYNNDNEELKLYLQYHDNDYCKCLTCKNDKYIKYRLE